MNTTELLSRLTSLKKTGKKIISNCFFNFAADKENEWDVTHSNDSIIILRNENNIKHLYFYSVSVNDLMNIIASDNHFKRTVAEILSKDSNYLKDDLTRSGFICIAEMMRLSNPDISSVFSSELVKYRNNDIGKTADISDINDIEILLNNTFDPRISHIPEKSEINKLIKNDEIMIEKDEENKIISLLQTIITPKSFYINQIINNSKRETIHAIMLKKLNTYILAGGKYAYSWVEKTNIASLKFHEKYGMGHDGLWSMVYFRE